LFVLAGYRQQAMYTCVEAVVVDVLISYHRLRVLQGDCAEKPFNTQPKSHTLRPGGRQQRHAGRFPNILWVLIHLIRVGWSAFWVDSGHGPMSWNRHFSFRPSVYCYKLQTQSKFNRPTHWTKL